MLVETRHPAHAKELVAALPVHELELYDGILAVCSCLALTKLKAMQHWLFGTAS